MTQPHSRGNGISNIILERLEQYRQAMGQVPPAAAAQKKKRGKKRPREEEEDEDERSEPLVADIRKRPRVEIADVTNEPDTVDGPVEEEEEEEEVAESGGSSPPPPEAVATSGGEEDAMDIDEAPQPTISIRIGNSALVPRPRRNHNDDSSHSSRSSSSSDDEDSYMEYEGRYTSLDTAYNQIVRTEKRKAGRKLMPKNERKRKKLMHADCFLCDQGDPEYDSKNPEGHKGWSLCIKNIEEGITKRIPLKVIGRETSRIFDRHTWQPARRAWGGQDPPNLKFLAPAKVIEHIHHTRSPYFRSTKNSDMLFHMSLVMEKQLIVEGAVDVKLAETLMKTIVAQEKFNDKHKKEAPTMAEMQLDPRKLYAMGDKSKIEHLWLRGADALGGATAHGSTASMMSNAQDAAPNFGMSLINVNPAGLRMRSESTRETLVQEFSMPF